MRAYRLNDWIRYLKSGKATVMFRIFKWIFRRNVGLSVTYDRSLGLMKLIERAVGQQNIGGIRSEITPDRFKLSGTGVRKMNFRVEGYKDGETSEQAAMRLTAAGHTLGDIGDLAGFLYDHPEEVERWEWVYAISEDSRWANANGDVYVPFASVYDRGATRYFGLRLIFGRLSSDGGGVLVVCK